MKKKQNGEIKKAKEMKKQKKYLDVICSDLYLIRKHIVLGNPKIIKK